MRRPQRLAVIGKAFIIVVAVNIKVFLPITLADRVALFIKIAIQVVVPALYVRFANRTRVRSPRYAAFTIYDEVAYFVGAGRVDAVVPAVYLMTRFSVGLFSQTGI